MKILYSLLVATTFFGSCGVRINYLGSSLAPTEHVDVYVEASAIKKPYTIIGKGYPLHFTYNALTKLQKKVVETARKKAPTPFCSRTSIFRKEVRTFIPLPEPIVPETALSLPPAAL
jgi:hypothetical protein